MCVNLQLTYFRFPQKEPLSSPKRRLIPFFFKTYFDNDRSHVYSDSLNLLPAPPPSLPFNVSTPSFQEFGRVLRKCRNSSAPGPNGIPYLIWKRCPFLSQLLYKLICRVWATGLIPAMWQKANIILIAKSEKLDDPSQFRPIALGNCDGKIFFSLLSRRLSEYLLSNNYLAPSIQKVFLPRVAGCVEHTTLSLSALKDAKKAGRSICTTWIDL